MADTAAMPMTSPLAEDAPVDVVVVGSGVLGGALAAVLARHGATTVLVGPRATDGLADVEPTLPVTSFLFQLAAERFDVPELALLTQGTAAQSQTGLQVGTLKTLGFVHHVAGRPQDGRSLLQFNVPGEHGELHLSTREVAAWLAEVAAAHGAHVADGLTVLAAAVDSSGVQLDMSDGSSLRARCVVDCGPSGSAVASAIGSVDTVSATAPRLRMITGEADDVLRYERLSPPLAGGHPWSTGSVHHVFAGGWLAVVPRPSGRAAAAAPGLGSCGLTLVLDAEDGALVSGSAESLLQDRIAALPTVSAQFRRARLGPLREVQVGTVASRTVADRVLLLGSAATGAQPFPGQRLSSLAEHLLVVAGDLLAALRDDDLRAGRFGYVEQLQLARSDEESRLALAAVSASVDPHLWSALARVWLAGSMLAALSVKAQIRRTDRGRETALAAMRQDPASGTCFPQLPGCPELLQETLDLCLRARSGGLDPATAGDEAFAVMRACAFLPPVYGFADPQDREYVLTLGRRLRTLYWVHRQAPPPVRELLSSYGLRGGGRMRPASATPSTPVRQPLAAAAARRG